MKQIPDPSINDLLKEFFFYMDIIEESDSGMPFKPNYIYSCRILDGERIGQILVALKQKI